MSTAKYSPNMPGALGALVLSVLVLIQWSTATPLIAQEQEAREIQQTAGPYDIAVLTERSNLSVGRARFIITVGGRASGEPVTGAEILIHIKHQADGTEGWAAAFSVPKFPGTYHAQARFDSPGFYLVSIEVQGPLGDGVVLLEPLHVPDLRGYSSGSLVFVGLTLVLLAGAAYIWWSAARNKKRREAQAMPPSASASESTDGPAERGPGNGGQG